jgi:hypothetical protein
VTTNGARSKWRARAGVGAGVAGTFVLVVLLVGTTSAVPLTTAATASTVGAPYSGTVETGFLGNPLGCGIGADFPVLPFFNLTSGQALASVKATAHSCGSTNASVYLQSNAGFTSASYKTTTGVHHLAAHWLLTFSVSLSAKPGTAGHAVRAQFAVYFQFELFDRTTGLTYYQGNYPEIYDTVTSGTYSHTYTKLSESVFLNATLIKGDSYEFEAQAVIAVESFVGPGTGTASASVTMGSGADQALLSSVVRS